MSSPSNSAAGEWALITGASQGLGEEFARQLAPRGINLLLTARSGDLLEKIAAELRAAHKIKIEICTADLADSAGPQKLLDWLAALKITPTWLINNAGFGHALPFEEISEQRLLDCVQVNIIALTQLTRALLPEMRKLSEARLINLSSAAAFQPVPYFAVYSATKAYVLSLTEALREELIDTNIRVTALCPGPTSTNFGKNNEIAPRMMHSSQTAPDVVRMALRGSDRNRALVVPQQRWLVFLMRFLPRIVIRKAAAWLLRDSLKK